MVGMALGQLHHLHPLQVGVHRVSCLHPAMDNCRMEASHLKLVMDKRRMVILDRLQLAMALPLVATRQGIAQLLATSSLLFTEVHTSNLQDMEHGRHSILGTVTLPITVHRRLDMGHRCLVIRMVMAIRMGMVLLHQVLLHLSMQVVLLHPVALLHLMAIMELLGQRRMLATMGTHQVQITAEGHLHPQSMLVTIHHLLVLHLAMGHHPMSRMEVVATRRQLINHLQASVFPVSSRL